MIDMKESWKIVSESEDGDAAFALLETHKQPQAEHDIIMPKRNRYAFAKAVY